MKIDSVSSDAYVVTAVADGGEQQIVICASGGQGRKWALIIVRMACDMGGKVVLSRTEDDPVKHEEVLQLLDMVLSAYFDAAGVELIIRDFQAHFNF